MSYQLRTSHPLCSSVAAFAVMFPVQPRPVGPSSHEPGRNEGLGLAGNCAHLSPKLVVLCGRCCEGLVTFFVKPPPPPPLCMLCRRAVQAVVVVVVVAGGRACIDQQLRALLCWSPSQLLGHVYPPSPPPPPLPPARSPLLFRRVNVRGCGEGWRGECGGGSEGVEGLKAVVARLRVRGGGSGEGGRKGQRNEVEKGMER